MTVKTSRITLTTIGTIGITTIATTTKQMPTRPLSATT
jgi:hypothetical protein